MMSRIVKHNRFCDGSIENATCMRETNRAKNQRMEGEISIEQLIQLSSLFSRLHLVAQHPMKLIRAASAMLSTEWTITARRAVLQGRFAQIHFSGTNHQNRSYLDNISTNQ